MSFERGERDLHGKICANLEPAFVLLFEAWVCAQETASEPWDFAVSIRELCRQGITLTGLRWLVRKGYVANAREVTTAGEIERVVRPPGDMTICRRTSFVLTATGVAVALSLLEQPAAQPAPGPEQPRQNGPCVVGRAPKWDLDERVLRLGDQVVKRFKWQALNQEIVLSAFEEEHWPPAIYDPLPPLGDLDPKRRLQDTVKALNRHQDQCLLRFHTNRGEGVWWEIVRDSG